MAYTTITDPSAYFQTALYNGNGGGTNNVVNDGNSNLQPDWVWVKERSSTSSHALTNSTVGAGYILSSNNTNDQSSASAFTSFDSDGFTVGSDGKTNESGQTYVGWQWKANGGTTSSNSNGTITSTVQADTTAGFSIISYTGNGTNGATIGHGLNETPQLFIPKCLSTTTNWEMYYFPTGGTKQYGYLNLTNAFATWSYTAPTSTTIGLSGSGDSNGNGRSMIGYAFHSVQGYSKIGTYTGNGNADGAFVYTGFKPAWVMIKCTSAGSRNWVIYDNKINPFNEMEYFMRANSSGAETRDDGYSEIDFLSNGFKLRGASGDTNASSATYIYMTFAESPLVATNNIPTTAR